MYVANKSKSSVIGCQWLLPLEINKINDVNQISHNINPPDIDEIMTEVAEVFSDIIGEILNYTASFSLKKMPNLFIENLTKSYMK